MGEARGEVEGEEEEEAMTEMFLEMFTLFRSTYRWFSSCGLQKSNGVNNIVMSGGI